MYSYLKVQSILNNHVKFIFLWITNVILMLDKHFQLQFQFQLPGHIRWLRSCDYVRSKDGSGHICNISSWVMLILQSNILPLSISGYRPKPSRDRKHATDARSDEVTSDNWLADLGYKTTWARGAIKTRLYISNVFKTSPIWRENRPPGNSAFRHWPYLYSKLVNFRPDESWLYNTYTHIYVIVWISL